jgi:hypothetical protein
MVVDFDYEAKKFVCEIGLKMHTINIEMISYAYQQLLFSKIPKFLSYGYIFVKLFISAIK